jgi:hypothetical protein
MATVKSNLKYIEASWEKATQKVDTSSKQARDEMMAVLVELSKKQIKGTRPAGQKATAGQSPMNRTGNLRKSIRGKKTTIGFGRYSAEIGTDIVYGLAVERGGKYAPPSWAGTSAMRGFPYMEPAFDKFKQKEFPKIVNKYFKGWVIK